MPVQPAPRAITKANEITLVFFLTCTFHIQYKCICDSFIMAIQDHGSDYTDEAGKIKHSNDNPFIEPAHGQTIVDMKGDLKLNFYVFGTQ